MSQYLSEAFKRLSVLNEETFTVDSDGLEDFIKFENEDEIDDSIDVIDIEAETTDDLQDSYIGKVILECTVCHSKFYKDVEDVIIENDLANIEEECPFCYTAEGYKVVGQVAAFNKEDEETDTKDEKDTKDKLEEGIFDKFNKKKPVNKPTTKTVKKWAVLDGWQHDLTIGTYDSKTEAEKAAAGRGQDGRYKVQMIDTEESIKEGFLGFKTKKEKEVEKRNKEREAEIDRQAEERHKKWLADWEAEQRERDARSRETQKRLDAYDNAKRRNSSNGGTGGNTGKAGVYYSGGDYYTESLNESVNNVNVETDTDVINVNSDDNGKVTVSTEPKTTATNGNEVIEPIEPELQTEINDNVEDGEEIEIDVDEFDEESFDELGEGYLKKVYENVNSFKTSKVSLIKDRLVVEGVINFKSGKAKKTNFIFESKEATKTGKVRFIGENKEIARGRKSFTITGKIKDKKFLSESFNYNYGVKGANGKAQRLYGTIKRGK